jgi:hypothetical protein
LGISAQANGKKLNTTAMIIGSPSRLSIDSFERLSTFFTRQGVKTECAMTRLDVGWLCDFTAPTKLHKIVQPYRLDYSAFHFAAKEEVSQRLSADLGGIGIQFTAYDGSLWKAERFSLGLPEPLRAFSKILSMEIKPQE